jgi:pSer/pThr/pTyr-binding forkhead associated (FHA) protein
LQDQQSSRGTLVNGQRSPAQRLKNGDRIDVGDSSMVFYCQE